jgi:hypothetical protein
MPSCVSAFGLTWINPFDLITWLTRNEPGPSQQANKRTERLGRRPNQEDFGFVLSIGAEFR